MAPMTPGDAWHLHLQTRQFRVGVVGLGYVGLPLALTFTSEFSVLGFDTDARRVAALQAGRSELTHVPDAQVSDALASKRLNVTTDPARLRTCDAVLICVPTPLGKHREPDMRCVVSACETLVGNLREGALVVLESTTYPGTTEELVLPILQKGGQVGRDFFLAYSPEREDPGNPTHNTRSTPKVVGGLTDEARTMACLLYSSVGIRTVPVSCCRTAEATKLLENIFRGVNIALVNELKILCHAMGLDIWEIIRAASTKPFGFMPFEPGPGLGGHCIPIDPFYLTWKAREFGQTARFIELAGEINGKMPEYVVSRLVEGLSRQGRALRGSRLLLVGVAYKAGVCDCREAPAIAIEKRLTLGGAQVFHHDPLVDEAPWGGLSVPLHREHLQGFDAALVLTAQPGIDWSALGDVPLVVDTRNVPELQGHPNLVTA